MTRTGERKSGRKPVEASPTWSTLQRAFTVSPGSNVPSLLSYDVDRGRNNQIVKTQLSVEILTPPDPGMRNEFTPQVNWMK